MTLGPGIHRDIDPAVYFADPCEQPSLTQSIAKILLEQTPLHACLAHPRLAVQVSLEEDDGAEKYDKAKAIGNAAHALMLDRGKALAVGEFKDWKTKPAKEYKADALAAGREPILRKHYDVAGKMADAALEQLAQIEGCERAFVTGDSEVVAVAREDDIWLRTMMDFVTPDLREIWDLKTGAQSASPFTTGKRMANDGWHIQAAMHERILDAVDPAGAGRRRFFYVAQENEPPFALTVNEIGEGALTIGRKQLDFAVNLWRECITTKSWPGYPLRIIRPELPGWFSDGWLARELIEDEARQLRTDERKIIPLQAG